jgi:Adenylate and Guanylate cyclase catalytic domain
MVERNAGLPPERRIEFRTGIHLGDAVVESDGDLMGDGVNIAARPEGIAKPGAICLSSAAYEQVRDKVQASFYRSRRNAAQKHRPTGTGLQHRPPWAFRLSPRRGGVGRSAEDCAVFDDAGEQNLKNIGRAVRVFRVRDRGGAASQRPTLALPDKSSIAVLPFRNLSADPEQEYFADGVVEDITMALSLFRWLFVIARNSSFTYKGQAVDVKQVGCELGVRYVLGACPSNRIFLDEEGAS